MAYSAGNCAHPLSSVLEVMDIYWFETVTAEYTEIAETFSISSALSAYSAVKSLPLYHKRDDASGPG